MHSAVSFAGFILRRSSKCQLSLLTLLAPAMTAKSETEHSGLPPCSLRVGKLGHRILSNSAINGGRSWVTICQRISKSTHRILHFGLLDDPLAEIWTEESGRV